MKENSDISLQIWRGFSGREDYNNSPPFETWIWAPLSCALSSSYQYSSLPFEITNVQLFEFNNSPDYEVGVNIQVQISATLRRLMNDYKRLEGKQFFGRFVLM